MATWRVVVDENAIATIEKTASELERRWNRARKSRRSVGAVDPRWAEFDNFVEALDDMACGKADPAERFKYVGTTPDDVSIYVLIVGRWHAVAEDSGLDTLKVVSVVEKR
jgi:hypothetical protein